MNAANSSTEDTSSRSRKKIGPHVVLVGPHLYGQLAECPLAVRAIGGGSHDASRVAGALERNRPFQPIVWFG
jgi:hypothetical protein